ncbi:hypothetical protein BDR26DRAFT_890013 [Obelidium mucronatum]|nr:hypothetical protein BDR26DRAFT_890005 [Obelidium mucronatum]KAI9353518.1 hypothetical protein BDR26DRAFT_928802 [Obelidium mucronatum]KAI9353522.1 hypothetical protein BDR26DRAFT_890013 [Obelidium mucronatum]
MVSIELRPESSLSRRSGILLSKIKTLFSCHTVPLETRLPPMSGSAQAAHDADMLNSPCIPSRYRRRSSKPNSNLCQTAMWPESMSSGDDDIDDVGEGEKYDQDSVLSDYNRQSYRRKERRVARLSVALDTDIRSLKIQREFQSQVLTTNKTQFNEVVDGSRAPPLSPGSLFEESMEPLYIKRVSLLPGFEKKLVAFTSLEKLKEPRFRPLWQQVLIANLVLELLDC